jgi:hypothetical protein
MSDLPQPRETSGPTTGDVASSETPDDTQIVVRYGGVLAAVATPRAVVLMPAISVLEPDHPRRRFVATVALVARLMTAPPDAEPYDEQLAQFYARIVLMPNQEFEILADALSDVELAEHYNLPLDQVRAKRTDIDIGW